MTVQYYVARQTFVHRLHPVAKILGTLFLCGACLVFTDPLWLAPLAAGVAVLVTVSGSWATVVRFRFILSVLALVCLVIWALAGGEPVLVRWGPLAVSGYGLKFGLGVALKLGGTIITALVLLSTTRVEELGAGLRRLGLPFAFSFVLSLAFRLVPTLSASARTVVDAQRVRGLDPAAGHLLARIRKHVPLLIPIFVLAMRRANLMAMALASRGFGCRRRRSEYIAYRFGWTDGLALVVTAGLLAGTLALRLLGHGVLA